MTIAERRLRGTAVLERADKGETPQLGTFAPLVGGTRRETGNDVAVRSPYDDQLAAVVHRAGPEEIEAAIAASAAAFRETRKLPSWRREQVLESVAATIAERADDLARTIVLEAGKPLKTARLEVERASFTFKVAAEERIAWGATVQSGQSCISVQRVYVHSSVWDSFVPDLTARMSGLRAGDPLDPETDVGPLIDTAAVERVEEWVREAVESGARALAGGTRRGRIYEPTVLADVREDMRVSCQEVFAPVVGLFRYDDVASAIRDAGTSEFGLQAGLFTNDLRVVDEAFEQLETGGLMINDLPALRVDHMPYGGVKSSGSGREGLRYAIEEMTELKLLTLNDRRRSSEQKEGEHA